MTIDYKKWNAQRAVARAQLAILQPALSASSVDDAPHACFDYAHAQEYREGKSVPEGTSLVLFKPLSRTRFLNKLAELYAEAYCPKAGPMAYGYTKKTIMNVLHLRTFDCDNHGEEIYRVIVKGIERNVRRYAV